MANKGPNHGSRSRTKNNVTCNGILIIRENKEISFYSYTLLANGKVWVNSHLISFIRLYIYRKNPFNLSLQIVFHRIFSLVLIVGNHNKPIAPFSYQTLSPDIIPHRNDFLFINMNIYIYIYSYVCIQWNTQTHTYELYILYFLALLSVGLAM
jgi:hypothetical protein